MSARADVQRAINRGDPVPDGTTVSGRLDLTGASVEHLPRYLTILGMLVLSKCDRLVGLPEGLKARSIMLDGCRINTRQVAVFQSMPDTLMVAIVGRRLGDVFQHRLIDIPQFYDAIITKVSPSRLGGVTFIEVDRSLTKAISLPRTSVNSVIMKEAA